MTQANPRSTYAIANRVVDGANSATLALGATLRQRHSLTNPTVVPIRTQLGKPRFDS